MGFIISKTVCTFVSYEKSPPTGSQHTKFPCDVLYIHIHYAMYGYHVVLYNINNDNLSSEH